jgi:hypothetical protein
LHREREEHLRQQLQDSIAVLQEQPHDPVRQERHGGLTHQVQEFKERAVGGKRTRCRLCWMLKGDAVSKEFFQAVQEKSESATIASLKNPEEEETRNRRGL